MLSSSYQKTTPIRASKIVHKSYILHPQARFVNEEVVCLIFGINFEDIYTVECWCYIVYVHGKGVSRFVSYADFPPIIGVGLPTARDRLKWRKRWSKSYDYRQKQYAPDWWAEFLHIQFSQATSEYDLQRWWHLLSLINFAFTNSILQQLQHSYQSKREGAGSRR
ncbi:MAG: hypothetical protein F6K61_01590 [Sphaerospermopsis sp. SIO1G1]|nr:hypothetical protein [Sphaerospermopsis sp. SIO1G1]